MGLIRAAKDALSSLLADQWREFFYCDSLSNDVLMVKGRKKDADGRGKGSDNIISNGSVVAVNEGQCMIIVEQGKIVDVCADTGEFVYDSSTEPSLFYGDLGENIKSSFSQLGKRFSFGGSAPKDQRVYFFNTKEILNNLFGTPAPVPFRVLDRNTGFDFDTAVKVNGQYTFQIVDPVLFYMNVCANVTDSYKKAELAGTMKSELLTALQPVLAEISGQGVRPYELPGFSEQICRLLAEALSEKWTGLRGIRMVSMAINSSDIPAEDKARFQKWQETAMLRNSDMQAARQTEAFANMLENSGRSGGSGGAMEGAMNMMAMGMMGNMMGGMNGMAAGRQQAGAGQTQQAGSASGWTCSCGHVNQGKFCQECGSPKPAASGWTCSCGHVNQGKFCQECGKKRPEGA